LPSRSPLGRLACSPLFFFQAEDGIRDFPVTGVQTCALPIFRGALRHCIADAGLFPRDRGSDTRFALGRAACRSFAPVPATEGKGDVFVRWTVRRACPATGRIGGRSCEHWPRAARKVGQSRGMRLYRGMVTRLYTHPIYLEHLTPAGHPERPDR